MRLLAAFFPVTAVAALFQPSEALDKQGSSDLETHIWALEDAYVTADKNAEHKSILALLHERFLGWPD